MRNLVCLVLSLTIPAWCTSLEIPTELEDFPLHLSLTYYENWSGDIKIARVWTALPETPQDIVICANWVKTQGLSYTLRASGQKHNWSPFGVSSHQQGDTPQNFCCGQSHFTPKSPAAANETCEVSSETPPNVILLDMSKLTKIGITSTSPGESAFWAEAGALLDDILTALEDQNLGMAAIPAPGDITIGGALAVGAHGTGIPAIGETLSPGHTLGSLSNLVISLTTVLYDSDAKIYGLKTISRDDPEAKVFLVNLGRTILTDVTMRAGPLQYIRCQSFVNVPADELFSSEDDDPKLRTVASYLDQSGRMEVILFPFTTNPWLKVWTASPQKPLLSREVSGPYNYPFSDNIPKEIADIVALIQEHQQWLEAVTLGATALTVTSTGLIATVSGDIWGPAKNTLLYIKPTTLRYSEGGYAIHAQRKDVQKVLSYVYGIYQDLIQAYQCEGKFPINGPLEVRVTGLDNPSDVLVPGAESPALSGITPMEGQAYDTAIWVNILTLLGTPYACEFMMKFEEDLLEEFDGTYGKARVEWSKGWGYTNGSPWANTGLIEEQIYRNFKDFHFFRDVLEKYDPFELFTSRFLRSILH